MVVSREDIKPDVNIKIKGELLEQVKTFRYLGHIVTEDVEYEAEELEWQQTNKQTPPQKKKKNSI